MKECGQRFGGHPFRQDTANINELGDGRGGCPPIYPPSRFRLADLHDGGRA